MSEAIQFLTIQGLLLSSLFGTLSAPLYWRIVTKASYLKSKSITVLVKNVLFINKFKFTVVYLNMESTEDDCFQLYELNTL